MPSAKPVPLARKLYAPLRRGLAAADPAQRPEGLHAGGPALKILAQEGPAATSLALWTVETIQHLVPAAEQAALEEGLAQLREVLALRERLVAALPPEKVRMGEGYEALSKAAGKLKDPAGESAPLVAVRAALGAFRCLPGGYNERAVSFCGDAVEAAVKALSGEGGESVRRYLVELDERALALEFAAWASAKGPLQAPPAIRRVLWRGADEKGHPALWVVRLAEGGHGILSKVGRRWAWTQGTRDEVLASVPDAQFAAAVETTTARDS